MALIDTNKLKENSCGDDEMLVELVNMGMNRIDRATVELSEALAKEDWDSLSRLIHKLRPIIFYTGLTCLEEDLQRIESNSKARLELDSIPAQIDKVNQVMLEAKSELNDILNKTAA